ncbi:MAG TPA: hypothetical protein ENH82_13760 [bacterium]|nr:hypothetical protein [bacterium]
MKYAVRAHHRNYNPPRWEASAPKLFDKKEDALAQAKMMNQEWGRVWVYAAFEYHGRGDYRIVQPEGEQTNEKRNILGR